MTYRIEESPIDEDEGPIDESAEAQLAECQADLDELSLNQDQLREEIDSMASQISAGQEALDTCRKDSQSLADELAQYKKPSTPPSHKIDYTGDKDSGKIVDIGGKRYRILCRGQA
ncbi:hypothetical protein PMG11_11113 [Penicillium brasilianum]|uniref:Uncharacterized protein n=1 Tax=Penicillium brasilianum TaxID=104259 RepID=A0A0F7U2X7_PENBI|nr:hypothetical protein PMG11_11113 [Penicillium brasilianum]